MPVLVPILVLKILVITGKGMISCTLTSVRYLNLYETMFSIKY